MIFLAARTCLRSSSFGKAQRARPCAPKLQSSEGAWVAGPHAAPAAAAIQKLPRKARRARP